MYAQTGSHVRTESQRKTKIKAESPIVNPDGGIDAAMLETLRNGYKGDATDKALKNALSGTSIAKLALNSENAAMMDTHFSYRVRTKGITDQKSSGRCWLFSNPLSDGGQFTGVSNLITKYGLVPSDAMPETFCSNNTSAMSSLLKLKLREDGLRLREAKGSMSQLLKMKEAMLTEIYRFLTLCLGEPPVSFKWTRCNSKDEIVSVKEYTPKSFYEEYVGTDLENNYIMVMNDPCREYWKVYEIDFDRHVYDGHNWLYVNLPIEKIKEMAIASIKDNTAMYFSCDVAKFMDRSKGTLDLANFDYESLSGFTFGMDKRERVQTHASGSSHAMTLIAVDIDKENGKPLKWMVENSWGPESGYKGNLIMTDEWFNEYMFRLVVEKKYVPEDVLKLLESEPELLPAWDPMFCPEN